MRHPISAREQPALVTDADRLLEAARALSGARELPQLMEVVRRAARDLTGADGVTFILREGDLVHYADEDAIAPLWKGQRFPAEACVSGWAMLHRETVVIEDVYADPRVPQGAYRPTFVKSMAMVPVRPEDPVAAIGAYWARRHRATAREVDVVESLAGLAATALANVALWGELMQAVRVRDDFLAVASHELRTPLTPLTLQLGRAAAALDHADVSAAREAVERARGGLERVTRLVTNLLDASHAMHDRLALEREPLDLAALAAEVIARQRGDPSTPVVLHAPAPVHGRWDRRRLEHALQNLLSNALRFGRGQAVEVEVTRGEGGARLAVRDHGPGIAPEDQHRVFDRFERAAATRHLGGLGLGLWLARRNVEAHGGHVVITSAPGQGATFTLVLPDDGG